MAHWPAGTVGQTDVSQGVDQGEVPQTHGGRMGASAGEMEPPLAPAAIQSAIGVVGGGQLAWMLAEAAAQLGIAVHVQTPGASDPAARAASSVIQAPLQDTRATAELASRCRAITFENEWIDLEALAPLEQQGVCFLPSLAALEPLVCKHNQRQLLDRLQLPTPRWTLLPPLGEPLPEGFVYPLMAKAATGGYDGKGTEVLQGPSDLQALQARLAADAASAQPLAVHALAAEPIATGHVQDPVAPDPVAPDPTAPFPTAPFPTVDPAADPIAVPPSELTSAWIVEELVAFERELAITVARDAAGRVEVWPLVQTHQHRQVCDWVLTPAAVPHAVQAYARNIACSLVTALQYVGVLSIELFYGPAGLQVNEIAPRAHNSAHLTIEATHTSQFSQQARIVAGLPLASTALQVPGALMVNLLGFEAGETDYAAQRAALAALPGASLHWYGKQGSAVGRKLGHITLVLQAASAEGREREARERLDQVRAIWPLPPQEP